MVKLNKSKGAIIDVYDMKCGQIAEIVKGASDKYKGRIVQRHQDTLISIGEDIGKSWPDIFSRRGHAEVRLLEVGETIEIVKN